MKHKLRIDDLSVTSFSTDEDGLARQRGTVRGMQQPVTPTFDQSCIALQTCDTACQSNVCATNLRTCGDTCNCTMQTCPRMTCSFTCYDTCPE